MTRTTKAQRAALLALFKRQSSVATYRQFRVMVQPYFDGTGCVLVPWCGMFVGIETDGYAHS